MIVGITGVLTTTFVGMEYAEHPLISVVLTESLEELFTLMDCVVSPVDHKYFLDIEADKLTDPPWQNVVELPDVIVGVVGVLTVTLVGKE